MPVGLAAKSRNVPIITHDSDAVPGLANRIVGRWAAIHATGMPPDYYSYPKDSIRYVGIPLDEHIQPVTESLRKRYKSELGIPQTAKVLLVSGGGLGSLTLNELALKMAPKLIKNNNLFILHITGSEHQQDIQAKYRAVLGEGVNRVRVVGFTSEFYKYVGAADIVISRAGATTLAELAIQEKAVILIPAPFLTSGQQLKNAQRLEETGAVIVLPNDTTAVKLESTVKELLNNPERRLELERNIAATAQPHAAEKLAKLILAEIKNR